MSLTPAVWEFKTACISPAMKRRVAACCKIQARRTRGKLMVVPASSSASTNAGGLSLGMWLGGFKLCVQAWKDCVSCFKASRACGESWLVQSYPNVC